MFVSALHWPAELVVDEVVAVVVEVAAEASLPKARRDLVVQLVLVISVHLLEQAIPEAAELVEVVEVVEEAVVEAVEMVALSMN